MPVSREIHLTVLTSMLHFRPGAAASMKNQRQSPNSTLTTSSRNSVSPAKAASRSSCYGTPAAAAAYSSDLHPQAAPRRGAASRLMLKPQQAAKSETAAMQMADSSTSSSCGSSSLEAQLTKLSSLIEQKAAVSTDDFDLDAHLETIKQALVRQKARALNRDDAT